MYINQYATGNLFVSEMSSTLLTGLENLNEHFLQNQTRLSHPWLYQAGHPDFEMPSRHVWAGNHWLSYFHPKTRFNWMLNSEHGPKREF